MMTNQLQFCRNKYKWCTRRFCNLRRRIIIWNCSLSKKTKRYISWSSDASIKSARIVSKMFTALMSYAYQSRDLKLKLSINNLKAQIIKMNKNCFRVQLCVLGYSARNKGAQLKIWRWMEFISLSQAAVRERLDRWETSRRCLVKDLVFSHAVSNLVIWIVACSRLSFKIKIAIRITKERRSYLKL